jgi:hypothetical protein
MIQGKPDVIPQSAVITKLMAPTKTEKLVNKLLPPYRIIGQLCILRQTLIINFSQKNLRYLT